MKRRRLYLISVVLLLSISLLIVRLMQLQLFQTESFTKHKINLIEESVEQRTQQLIIDEGRGEFLDRNGDPLSFEEKNVLILFPFLKSLEWPIEKVADILHVPIDTIEEKIEKSKAPFVFGGNKPIQLSEEEMKAINELEIQGLFALKRKFPKQKMLANQLIGITGENEKVFHKRYPDKVKGSHQKIGVSGLQETFDEWLIAEEQAKLIYHVDARGGPLFGVDVKYLAPSNPFYPLNVKTTVDSKLQQELEAVADTYNIEKGGLLLLDIEKSEIVANVSRPEINIKDPYGGTGATNYMFKSLIPGSVFKTVVTAAAINEEIVDETTVFSCSEDIYGNPAEKQYGSINIKTSFAVSCNRTFAELAKSLTEKNPDLIEQYAEKLGLIGDISWQGDIYHYSDFKQLQLGESRIFISEEEKKDMNFVSQTGIGQREVRVTPLGVANMMATIARGGQKYQVSAVSAVEYENGNSMFSFSKKKGEGETISPYAAMKLQKYLRGVVTDEKGTAQYLQAAAYPVAGKTGTAETGKYAGEEVPGNQLYNKWFAGYFPFDEPKYALVAVNLDVKINEGGIYPIFKDAVDAVYREEKNID